MLFFSQAHLFSHIYFLYSLHKVKSTIIPMILKDCQFKLISLRRWRSCNNFMLEHEATGLTVVNSFSIEDDMVIFFFTKIVKFRTSIEKKNIKIFSLQRFLQFLLALHHFIFLLVQLFLSLYAIKNLRLKIIIWKVQNKYHFWRRETKPNNYIDN